MPEPRTQRRLAAILAADVAGFSRLVGVDEVGTLAALREVWSAVFNPAVERFQGRVVKMMGDGALVEFASAVNAVEAAIEIQAAMTTHNTGSGSDTPITFRIGVNVGDIVIEGDDILGDGVNIAARLEAQAATGGILVSESVHMQIRGKVAAVFEDAGELALKNIAIPVRAWRWAAGQPTISAAATAPRPADASPAIAVLPFTNMSGDPEQEYFSDGVTEDIITDLSKVSGLMVIARNSSFAYKGKSPDIRKVGRELGVTSVLEGSIRRAGNRVRITAQLIDAVTGGHLWAERYDRDLTDIFAVQDEVTLQIVGALKVKLLPAERASIAHMPTQSIAAHDLYLRGRELSFSLLNSPESPAEILRQSIDAFEQSIAIDPGYAPSYVGMAMAYNLEYQNQWLGLPDALDRCIALARKGLELDPNDAFAHIGLAMAAMVSGDVATLKAEAAKALSISPSLAIASEAMGTAEVFSGNPLGALPYYDKAMRLDPARATSTVHFVGIAHLMAADYPTAAYRFRERISLVPRTDSSRALLAVALGHLGELDAARRVWRELKAIKPNYDHETYLKKLPWRPADLAAIRAGLARAGLPE